MQELHERTAIHRWFLNEFAELVTGPEEQQTGRTDLQGGGYMCGRVCRPHAVLLLELRAPRWRSAARRRAGAKTGRPAVVILGSGPNRIGQGIEFDYCCVHAAQTVRESRRDAVMINCNPETVSTDYDTSDRLYFEPLTLEHVLSVCEAEHTLAGVVVQFGGQTPLKLAAGLHEAGVPILGTSVEAIDLAEDRVALRTPARPAWLQGAALCERPIGARGACKSRRGRVPAARTAELRTRWPCDGDRLHDART